MKESLRVSKIYKFMEIARVDMIACNVKENKGEKQKWDTRLPSLCVNLPPPSMKQRTFRFTPVLYKRGSLGGCGEEFSPGTRGFGAEQGRGLNGGLIFRTLF